MSSITKEVDVDGECFRVTIDYEMTGKFIPGLGISPDEHPEAEWVISEAIDSIGQKVEDVRTLSLIQFKLDDNNIAAECENHAAGLV